MPHRGYLFVANKYQYRTLPHRGCPQIAASLNNNLAHFPSSKYFSPNTKPFPPLFGLINPIPFCHEFLSTITGIPIIRKTPQRTTTTTKQQPQLQKQSMQKSTAIFITHLKINTALPTPSRTQFWGAWGTTIHPKNNTINN